MKSLRIFGPEGLCFLESHCDGFKVKDSYDGFKWRTLIVGSHERLYVRIFIKDDHGGQHSKDGFLRD